MKGKNFAAKAKDDELKDFFPEGVSEDKDQEGIAEDEDFAKLFEEQQSKGVRLGRGEIFLAKVVSSDDEHYLIDTGAKLEGKIRKVEMPLGVTVAPGDLLPAMWASRGRESAGTLSLRGAARELQRRVLEDVFKKGERVEGRIFRFKGDSFFVGLSILPADDKFCGKGVPANFWDKLPYPANMPVGEVDIDDPRPYRRWLGRKMPMKIVSIGQDGDVIVSRKKIVVEMKDAVRQETLNTVKTGDVMAAKVRVIDVDSIKVDIEGVEGTMPAAELSWYPKPDPRRILKRGQTIDVKVVKIDKEKGVLHVSHRAVLTHPAEELVRKFPAKTIIEGTVERVLERGGCFISIPGVKREAYMPANEAVDDVAKKKGEKIKATVLRVDRENVRVVVSQRKYESAQMPSMVARYSRENQQLTLGDILGAMNPASDDE